MFVNSFTFPFKHTKKAIRLHLGPFPYRFALNVTEILRPAALIPDE